ncbi:MULTISPECIES: AraC family transcriptional regulator [unclassified Vibrio]|uniref:Helix-turn-helix domain-containing protein n=1 Tax=Vibrio sp. HB236076 TaxID=3232307 RepID=A0AB39HJF2_9VIBR|nr:AraC family transcriptional regulator [Vibrio sp. HB161653]MDP5253029.1 AraC family transcriptional regulator [Vibrio sp. HB161653]
MSGFETLNWEISLLGLAWASMAMITFAIQRPPTHAQKILFPWLIVLSLPLIHSGLEFHHIDIGRFFYFTNPTLNLLHGPLLLLYLRALTQTSPPRLTTYAAHLLPTLVFYAMYLLMSHPSIMRPAPQFDTQAMLTFTANPFDPWFLPIMKHFGLINALIFLAYSVSALMVLHKHQQTILDYFAKLSWSRRLAWVYSLPATLGLLSVINLLYNLQDPVPDTLPVVRVQLLSFVFFIGLLTVFGARQQPVFSTHSLGDPTAATFKATHQQRHDNPTRQTPHHPTIAPQARAIVAHLQRTQAFTDSEFSLYQLAEQLNLPYRDVSRTINQGLGKNFYQLINELRLSKVKSLLELGEKGTIMSAAMACGFNSKSSFNRQFKQRYGVTPSQVQRQAKFDNQEKGDSATEEKVSRLK